MEPKLTLTNLDTRQCVFGMNMTQQMCLKPGWPYELSVFLVNLLYARNGMVITPSARLDTVRATGYSLNLSLPAERDLSVMRELYENEADLSVPYMLLTESRAQLVLHLGSLIPVEPVILFRKAIVTQLNFSLLEMYSFPYLAMFLLPFLGVWLVLRMVFNMESPRQLKVS